MAKFEIPEDASLIAVATDIEAAGETPKDALMAVGVAVVAVCPRGIRVCGTARFGGWRIGSRRFSLRCAQDYLTHANDESADPAYWAEKRLQTATVLQWSDLHTYPRVAPFAYDGGVCDEGCTGACVACQNEIERENEAYRQWLQFRRDVYDECVHRNIQFKQVVDNGTFDFGWFMAIATRSDLCPPTYLYKDSDGHCHKYMSTQEIDWLVGSFVNGICFSQQMPRVDVWSYDGLRNFLKEEIALPPCPAEHTHIPEEDATTIAWTFAVLWHLIRDGRFEQ